MRTWSLIGVVALLIGGGIAILLFNSRKNSVEYHIQAYREAERQLTAEATLADKVRDSWRKGLGSRMGRNARLRTEMQEHKQDLIRLGYLEEHIFTITNAQVSDAMAAAQKAVLQKGTNWEFLRAGTIGANGLRVVAVKGMMPNWEDIAKELEGSVPKQD